VKLHVGSSVNIIALGQFHLHITSVDLTYHTMDQ